MAVALLLLSSALAIVSANRDLLQVGYIETRSPLAATQFSKVESTHKHSVVHFPDYERISVDLIERLTEKITKGHQYADVKALNCEWGDGPNFARVLPQYKASAFIGQGPVSFVNHCYKENTVEVLEANATSFTLSIKTEGKSSLACYDSYLFATLSHYHLELYDFGGEHRIEFHNLNPNDALDIAQNGVRVFSFCDPIQDLVVDLVMTLQMFLGGFTTHPNWPFIGSHTTDAMEKASVKFLQAAVNYTMEARSTYKVTLPESELKSGAFLAVVRLDGLDELIMYGAGGRTGHSTMTLWIEENGQRELYIVESQAGWYWPITGIQKTKFSEWIQLAENASFNVVVLPLRPEVQAQFNETAAYEWFKTVEGTPYGYHNFMFGWIDTPYSNMPPILQPELLTIALRAVEQVAPAAIANVFSLAINKRLGTQYLNIAELEVEAAKQNTTLLDLIAQVEEEGWWYADGLSYVCSSFVLAAYKRAGILGDLPLHGTEFTPRDVYSLNLFDRNYVRPQACVDADPSLPYCQILGKYRVDLGEEYSSISPYAHMDENCPSIAPEFYRPQGC
jgi:hypothetical protein